MVLVLEDADAEVFFQALSMLRFHADVQRHEVDDGVLLGAMARQVLGAAEPEVTPTGERYRVILDRCPSCRRVTSPEAEVSDTIAAEAACDAEVIEMRPGPAQGHATRAIPPATRRIVLNRAGWRCEVPRCRNRQWLDIHHRAPWSRGGRHEVENLIALCSVHHRATHEGGLAVDRLATGAVMVTHADGRRFVGCHKFGFRPNLCADLVRLL